MREPEPDEKTTVAALKARVAAFCEARDWDRYHNLKDLTLALSIEVGELLELLRWKDNAAVEAMLRDSKKREAVEEELADTLYFVLRIADRNQIDLSRALERKLAINARRYPVEKSKGRSEKYDEL